MSGGDCYYCGSEALYKSLPYADFLSARLLHFSSQYGTCFRSTTSTCTSASWPAVALSEVEIFVIRIVDISNKLYAQFSLVLFVANEVLKTLQLPNVLQVVLLSLETSTKTIFVAVQQ